MRIGYALEIIHKEGENPLAGNRFFHPLYVIFLDYERWILGRVGFPRERWAWKAHSPEDEDLEQTARPKGVRHTPDLTLPVLKTRPDARERGDPRGETLIKYYLKNGIYA